MFKLNDDLETATLAKIRGSLRFWDDITAAHWQPTNEEWPFLGACAQRKTKQMKQRGRPHDADRTH
jgi:hypothetical protein